MRGVARQKVRREDRRSADRDVSHRGVARRLSVLLLLPIGMRITCDGISEPQFSSVAEGPRLARSHIRQRGVPYQPLLLNAGAS